MSQLTLKEQASIPTATAAGEGAFWTKNTAPSTPVFTDDAGTDRTLGITLGTEQASTSGTSIDFTSIPSGVKRITVMFVGVSTTGTSPVTVRLGDSGGIEATGYTGSTSTIAVSPVFASISTGFDIKDTNTATITYHGTVILTLEDSTGFTWSCVSVMGRGDATTFAMCGGTKSLSAELDRISITTTGGSDTFDAGAINIQYEF